MVLDPIPLSAEFRVMFVSKLDSPFGRHVWKPSDDDLETEHKKGRSEDLLTFPSFYSHPSSTTNEQKMDGPLKTKVYSGAEF